MRHIASAQNPDFRLALRLAQGRPPRGEARVLLEGEHLCQAWLDLGLPVSLALIDAAAAGGGLARRLQRQGPAPCATLASALARQLSQLAHGPATAFLLVEPPRPEPPERISQDCLWLDRVQDPGNLGALLRTATAAGLPAAYLSSGCAAAWSPKALRGGQGAQFALRVYEQADLAALCDRLAIPLAATVLDGARDLYSADLRPPCAWVFGNEGAGVAPELVRAAAWRLRIPQAPGVESLNVAAAAAVCLFEQRRQRLGA